jgi:hypothetical protein
MRIGRRAGHDPPDHGSDKLHEKNRRATSREDVEITPTGIGDSLPAVNPIWAMAHPATTGPPAAPPAPMTLRPSGPPSVIPVPWLAGGRIGQGGTSQHPCNHQGGELAHDILHHRQSCRLTLIKAAVILRALDLRQTPRDEVKVDRPRRRHGDPSPEVV